MRILRILPLAAVLALLGSAAVAQTDAPKGYTGAYGPDAPNRAFGGPVPEVYPGPGLDQVGPDGISTSRPFPAAPLRGRPMEPPLASVFPVRRKARKPAAIPSKARRLECRAGNGL